MKMFLCIDPMGSLERGCLYEVARPSPFDDMVLVLVNRQERLYYSWRFEEVDTTLKAEDFI